METAQLQLVFNVIAITGVSSLASYCYLLKKENRKLATHEPRQEQGVRPAGIEQKAVAEKDIRTFAADQRTTWVEGMRLSATLCPRVTIEPAETRVLASPRCSS